MSEPFLGEIRIFGFNFAPRGYALCDGQILPINQNQSLYSLLGTTYGGDGRTTFALPDLRGRAAAHVGTAPGGTTKQLGSKSGAETVALTMGEMPSHNHAVSADASIATTSNPTGARYAQTSTPIDHAPDPGNAVAMNAATVATNGSGLGHENMQPFRAINFCIAIQGLFPPRN